MDPESLQIFVDIAQTRSFSRTARRFFISQSAVSQRVRLLEETLGHRLIERGRGRAGAELTEAGLRLANGAREILARLDALRQELAELDGVVAGSLRVATVYSIGLHALPPALSGFLAAYPQVQLHLEYLRTDRVYEATLTGAIDAGIVACPRPRPQIEIQPLYDEEMVVIAPPSHPLAAHESVAPTALEGLDFVAFDPLIPTRALVDEFLAAAGVAIRIVQAFDNIETIKRVVEIGMGVAIVPEATVRREAREGALIARCFAGACLTRPTGILLHRGRPRTNALERFLAYLRDYPGQKS